MQPLEKGSQGPDVTALQQALQQHGYNPGTVDGVFGAATESAVVAFQKASSLPPDGAAGPDTLAALGLGASSSTLSSVTALVTVDAVSRMFPGAPVKNIGNHLPAVLDALEADHLGDKNMVLMALATIRAETGCFLPLAEGQSHFNTSPGGQPFDLYDSRADLGNHGHPDGELFRGRGFVQLTGRNNYMKFGERLDIPLTDKPELACDGKIAARILAAFLKDSESRIRRALAVSDMKAARRAVNGGTNGLDNFEDAYNKGMALITAS